MSPFFFQILALPANAYPIPAHCQNLGSMDAAQNCTIQALYERTLDLEDFILSVDERRGREIMHLGQSVEGLQSAASVLVTGSGILFQRNGAIRAGIDTDGWINPADGPQQLKTDDRVVNVFEIASQAWRYVDCISSQVTISGVESVRVTDIRFVNVHTGENITEPFDAGYLWATTLNLTFCGTHWYEVEPGERIHVQLSADIDQVVLADTRGGPDGWSGPDYGMLTFDVLPTHSTVRDPGGRPIQMHTEAGGWPDHALYGEGIQLHPDPAERQ